MFMQSFVQIVPPVKEEIGCTETYVAINMKSTQACLLWGVNIRILKNS